MKKNKFNSLAGLDDYRAELVSKDSLKKIISLSAASCGRAAGALEIASTIKSLIEEYGLEEKVQLKLTGCHGFCQFEPDVIIFPGKHFYPNLRPQDIRLLIEKEIIKGEPAEELIFKDEINKRAYLTVNDLPFYRKQVRRLLDAHLNLDPDSLDDYLKKGGFKALGSALKNYSPEEIINFVTSSGLRGRGGAGFPTGLKWRLARKVESGVRYLICNGDEGDPGAYMDRGLLESNPFQVLEGMIIGGYAIGAKKGFIYIRQEYPLAIEKVEQALNILKEAGLIGDRILGTDFSFDLELVQGAGAFVCGEETALIASIEGRRPFPQQRPPFPVVQGLWGKPTVINNVETWANIPLILSHGPAWFSTCGSEKSKGTKIFSLVGQLRYTGLIEVPFGLTIKEIVEEIGGGAKNGQKIKAVQTGGPSGGCLPAELFNLPVDYESLNEAGSIMGSGGMIVVDDRTCVVDLALYFLKFASQESCGKCAPCRLGTRQLVRILEKITSGQGELSDLDLLEKTAWTMQKASLCGLGRMAANPVLSGLRYFRSEFEKHIVGRECPALVCKNLIAYIIEPEKCSNCQLCVKACPAGAIKTGLAETPIIDQQLCTRCGVCQATCPPRFSAIRKVNRREARNKNSEGFKAEMDLRGKG
ncbi:MAG: NADH-ubiquinone oxidoreductase-F iron-sulfur binding region domain-containing protein [Candidatus Saccharicenans sp.]